uniref:Uncharacterized protein n=1 Tax=Rhizophora mucronata TaxID=61149 RepID=A0A2P2QYS8_RHIMU
MNIQLYVRYKDLFTVISLLLSFISYILVVAIGFDSLSCHFFAMT